MKRLDIKVTDNINEVLEGLKEKTERSKTELVHDAIGLLWLTEKAYAAGHAIGEIDPETGTVIGRFLMPMFEGTRASSEDEPESAQLSSWFSELANYMADQGTPIPDAKLDEALVALLQLPHPHSHPRTALRNTHIGSIKPGLVARPS